MGAIGFEFPFETAAAMPPGRGAELVLQRSMRFHAADIEVVIRLWRLLVRIGPGEADAGRATGAETWMPHYTALLASAYEFAGQVEDALDLLNATLHNVERTGERWLESELHRRKGQLLLRQGQSEAAEDLYRKALSIADEQEAKLWELRAAASLARL